MLLCRVCIDQLKQQENPPEELNQQQLDSLDCFSAELVFSHFQALQNQKRKTEEAKSEASSVQRELLSLSETCETLEQQRSKLQNELTAKENQNAFLTGQLNNSKSMLEKELAQVSEPPSSSISVDHHLQHMVEGGGN